MAKALPLVGLVPAAGRGRRMHDLPGSKELALVPATDGGPPRPVCEALLRALAEAGVERTFVVLRSGKWDIPTYFSETDGAGLPDLAFLVTPGTSSVPASLDVAHPFVADATVVTGFADSCFTPTDALRRAVERHRTGGADVTLAVFASDRPDKTDMVELAGERVTGFRVKPGPCGLECTFGGAVWSPRMTDLLHRFLAEREATGGELQLSEVLSAALEAGLAIDAERSPGGRYLDLGTPDDLERFRSRGLAP